MNKKEEFLKDLSAVYNKHNLCIGWDAPYIYIGKWEKHDKDAIRDLIDNEKEKRDENE